MPGPKLLLEFVNLRLQCLRMGGALLGEFKELDRARKIPFLFLQAREEDRDLTEFEEVGLLPRGLLFAPSAQGQVPNLPGAVRVVLFS